MNPDPTNIFKTSLKRTTIHASFWTLFSHGLSQLIRFGGNLIMTRLLTPDNFGLMQIVSVFMIGMIMFSDVGIGANVVQNKRGEEPIFLKTAWTVQILRGFLIWLGIALITLPVALVYKESQLLWLLPFAGISILVDGFASTNLLLLYRHMQVGKLAFIEIVSQVAGVIAMIALAWEWPSVWTLAAAGIIASVVKTLISLVAFDGPKMGFAWEKESVHDIIHFGKWIFISSMTTFLVSRMDRIIMGLYLTIYDLGLYGIAVTIVSIFIEAVNMLNGKVLIPLFKHLQSYPPKEMKHRVFKIRLALVLLTLPPLFILTIWGQNIINFLYPASFSHAGWMLQIIAAGSTVKAITSTISPIFIAVGDSYRLMLTQLSQSVLLIFLMVTAGYFFGLM